MKRVNKFSKYQNGMICLLTLLYVVIWLLDMICLSLSIFSIALFLIVFIIDNCLFLYFLYYIARNYKIKYLFLGKKFKNQCKELEIMRKTSDYKYVNLTPSQVKKNYRQFGDIFAYFDNQETDTPFSLLIQGEQSYKYSSTEDKKFNHLIKQLYFNASTGDGLYLFFDCIAYYEPYTYNEYVDFVNKCEVFSEELKNYLLTPNFKDIFEFIKNQDIATPEQIEIVHNFDINESKILNYFSNEIFKECENNAVKTYIQAKKYLNIPENCEKIFYSEDGLKRFCIYFDKKLKAYKINKETFSFTESEEIPLFHSRGFWLSSNGYGIFADIALAENEIKSEIKNYSEFTMK